MYVKVLKMHFLIVDILVANIVDALSIQVSKVISQTLLNREVLKLGNQLSNLSKIGTTIEQSS
jgi:hypothetical protein